MHRPVRGHLIRELRPACWWRVVPRLCGRSPGFIRARWPPGCIRARWPPGPWRRRWHGPWRRRWHGPWRRRWPDLLTDRRETGADLRDFRGDVCETRIEVRENSVQVGLLGIHLRIISHTGLDVHGLFAVLTKGCCNQLNGVDTPADSVRASAGVPVRRRRGCPGASSRCRSPQPRRCTRRSGWTLCR